MDTFQALLMQQILNDHSILSEEQMVIFPNEFITERTSYDWENKLKRYQLGNMSSRDLRMARVLKSLISKSPLDKPAIAIEFVRLMSNKGY